MATGAGRGTHTCSPYGGHRDPHGDIATPTGTPARLRRHWHPLLDTGAPGPYRRHRDPRGTSAPSRRHGGIGAPRWHRNTGIPTGDSSAPPAPSLELSVPPFPSRGSNLRRAARWRLPGRGPPGSGPPEGRADGSSPECVGRHGEWAASTVPPRAKPVEVPSLCEAASPCPEGFLVRAVISVTANYPAPAGRAGSARGTPRAARNGVGREGGRQSCSLRHSRVCVRTQTHRVGVRVHTQRYGHTRACTHRCVWDIPKYVHRSIHTHTQTCGDQTQPQIQPHGWTHTRVHTCMLMHRYTLPCTPTRVPKCQHGSPSPLWGWAGGGRPCRTSPGITGAEGLLSSSSSGEGSNPGEHA